jgi:hypothetical protein
MQHFVVQAFSQDQTCVGCWIRKRDLGSYLPPQEKTLKERRATIEVKVDPRMVVVVTSKGIIEYEQ